MDTVIIGQGAAAFAAARAFRKYNQSARLYLISREGNPYSRVLLPYILRGKLSYDKLFFVDPRQLQELNAICLEDEVLAVDDRARRIRLAKTGCLSYDRLLIASGSHALWPPLAGIRQAGIYQMWSRADLDGLLPCFDGKKRLLVLGSGFIALQAAWVGLCRGLSVSVVEIAPRVMPTLLDERGSACLAAQMAAMGVDLHTATQAERVERLPGGSLRLYLRDHLPLEGDFMIVGTGVAANAGFLAGSGIRFEQAIPVDRQMRTNIDHVYAAGDVAAGPSLWGEPHLRQALWPTALEMGRVAGANMAGCDLAYEGSLNMNVTQMFGLTVASMGKFSDQEIDDARYLENGADYCKICYQNGAIVGICLVGSSEVLSLIGRVRPLLKKGLAVDCPPQKLDAFLNLRLYGGVV